MAERWHVDPYAAGDEVRVRVEGECVYCENTTADFVVLPKDRPDQAVRVRCEGCGAVTELPRETGDGS